MKPKIIDLDNTLMYSELWYMRDYKNDYDEKVKTYPASGNVSLLDEFLPWDVPKNSIAYVEVHDSVRNRWYEVEGYQEVDVGAQQWFAFTPIVKGTKAGLAIQRVNYSGQSRPGITFTMRLRTMTPPFIQ